MDNNDNGDMGAYIDEPMADVAERRRMREKTRKECNNTNSVLKE